MSNQSKIIVAMDFPSIEPARELVAKLDPKLCRLKIGSILFTQYGPALVEEWQKLGFSTFLDLKFHDIPATVAAACRAAAELGVWMVNLHVSAGQAALIAAREELAIFPASKRPLLIGVTVLTSLNANDLRVVGVNDDVASMVLRLATLAQTAELDGVVCSPQEIALLRTKLKKPFVLVTPGIRLTAESNDDQKRIATPKTAISAGADYLVIGRPITQAKDPLQTLQSIVADIQ
jgi:orotidine-5'-phosphate decarboxylase